MVFKDTGKINGHELAFVNHFSTLDDRMLGSHGATQNQPGNFVPNPGHVDGRGVEGREVGPLSRRQDAKVIAAKYLGAAYGGDLQGFACAHGIATVGYPLQQHGLACFI